jgi:hypothetical protein
MDTAKKYVKECTIGPIRQTVSQPIREIGNQSSLPTHCHMESTALAGTIDRGNYRERSSAPKQRPTRRSPSNPTLENPVAQDAHEVQIAEQPRRVRYIYWCVDKNKLETKLVHLQVLKNDGVKFILNLRSAYKTRLGLRRYFSLTDCYGVKFIQVGFLTTLFIVFVN